MKINILHLSDLHISKKNLVDAKHVIEKLLIDIENLKNTHKIIPDFVLFTGDLINKGENSDDEYNLALEHFIIPLQKALNIDENHFFYTPGNHEVNRKLTNLSTEKGIATQLANYDNFIEYYHNVISNDSEYNLITNKLEKYYSFKKTLNNKNLIHETKFSDVYLINIKKVKIGIISLNSSWRSSGFEDDKNRLIIGDVIFEDSLSKIKNCDLKIAIAHHPFEMLTEWDQKKLKKSMAQNIDIFCSGHIHDSNFEYIQPILGSFYTSVSGSIYSGRIKNGYSLLSLDLYNKNIDVYLRKWYSDRKEFDQETEKCKAGIVHIDNFIISNKEKEFAFEIAKIREELQRFNDNTNFIVPIDFISKINLNDVFVEPIISNVSHLDMNRVDKKKQDLNAILSTNENIVFIGNKEYGKTTLLKYIYNIMVDNDKLFENKIPIMIRFHKLSRNTNQIIAKNILPFLDGKYTKEKFMRYLENGNVVFLIDDYDDVNDEFKDQRKKSLCSFFGQYNKCRYIFALSEKLSQTFKEETIVLNRIFNTQNYYLSPFNTAKIRELLKKWKTFDNGINIDKILEQVVYYFKQLRIPVTPMAVTLFMGVLFRDNTVKTIRNEAYLIENYFETILEKIDSTGQKSEFDFKDKESFLAHIAFKMIEYNQYEWEKSKFEKEKEKYFEDFGEQIPEDRFFNNLFERGILQNSNNIISFKFKFWFNFFLAKKMQKDYKTRKIIMGRKDFLKYSTSIAYYSGLVRNDEELLKSINDLLAKELEDIFTKYDCKNFDSYKFDNQLFEFNTEIEKSIKEKNNETSIDHVKDKAYLDYDSINQKIDSSIESEYNNVETLTVLFSDIVRNTNEIISLDKQMFFKNSIDYYICLMWNTLEEFQDIIKVIDFNELKYILFEQKGPEKNDEDIQKINHRIEQFVLKLVPISIVIFMSDHLTNPKYEKSIISLLKSEKSIVRATFLILVLLKINFDEAINNVLNIINNSKSYVIDHIIYWYLTIYCYENKITENDIDKIIRILSDIRKKYSTSNKSDKAYFSDKTLHQNHSELRKKILLFQKKNQKLLS